MEEDVVDSPCRAPTQDGAAVEPQDVTADLLDVAAAGGVVQSSVRLSHLHIGR